MNFTQLREERGYKQRRRLALVSDVTESALAQIERGTVRSPRHETVTKLAAALDTTAAEVAAAILQTYTEKKAS